MEKLLFLDRVADAAPLSPECRRELLSAARVRAVGQGGRCTSRPEVLLIVSGIARVFVVTDDGRDVTQHFARAEEFVMPHPALPDGYRSNVEAITDVTCVALEAARFEAALSRFPELTTFYANHLRERSLWARDRRGRSEAVVSYEKFIQVYPGLETQVPTAHLASYLGLSPAEYMRARQRYRDRGIM